MALPAHVWKRCTSREVTVVCMCWDVHVADYGLVVTLLSPPPPLSCKPQADCAMKGRGGGGATQKSPLPPPPPHPHGEGGKPLQTRQPRPRSQLGRGFRLGRSEGPTKGHALQGCPQGCITHTLVLRPLPRHSRGVYVPGGLQHGRGGFSGP